MNEVKLDVEPTSVKRIDYATAKKIGLEYMTDSAVNKINSLPPLASVFDNNNEIIEIVNYHTSEDATLSTKTLCVSEIEYLFGIRYKNDYTPYLVR